jgi:hypothetical protein
MRSAVRVQARAGREISRKLNAKVILFGFFGPFETSTGWGSENKGPKRINCDTGSQAKINHFV